MALRSRRRCRPGRLAAALIAAAAVGLGGCSISQTLRPDAYTVARGDTLYAIAQRFDVSWHKLARWNQIRPPYRLRIGERLTLKPYPPLDYQHMPKHGRRRIVRAPQDTQAEQKRSIDTSVERLDRQIAPRGGAPGKTPSAPATEAAGNGPAGSTTPDARPVPPSDHPPADETAATQQPDAAAAPDGSAAPEPAPKPTPARVAGPGGSQWQWPASGSIVQAYAPSENRQGIAIGGAAGAAIYAASSGKVVYNGPGLKGFGQLIILKHAADYLSAYGFVRDSRVDKGQAVDVGERIASMGEGPGQKAMLHFEIRRDGDPLNPEKLLPAQP